MIDQGFLRRYLRFGLAAAGASLLAGFLVASMTAFPRSTYTFRTFSVLNVSNSAFGATGILQVSSSPASSNSFVPRDLVDALIPYRAKQYSVVNHTFFPVLSGLVKLATVGGRLLPGLYLLGEEDEEHCQSLASSFLTLQPRRSLSRTTYRSLSLPLAISIRS